MNSQVFLLRLTRQTLDVSARRSFHATGKLNGRHNFRKFSWANQVGQYDMKHVPKPLLKHLYNYPLCRDTYRQTYPGYWIDGKFHPVKEMEPELIVPDLKDFELKPYVSHRAPDIFQTEFTAKALFNKVYAPKIVEKFDKGQEVATKVSEEEVAAARVRAKQTGADLFVGPHSESFPTIASDEEIEEKRERTVERYRRYGLLADQQKPNEPREMWPMDAK